jgi:mono/diheme cytochrome c family protein
MNARLLLSLALTCASALACSDDQRDPSQWPITREELARGTASEDHGELTYRRYCIGCHGSDGKGNGGITGADFTAVGTLDKPAEQLIASVRDGKQGKSSVMPAHKPVLKEAQISEVVAYVRRRFGKPSAP